MSKTQRELLILVGILLVIAVILYIRLGGGGEGAAPPPATTPPAGQTAAPGTPGTTGPAQPGGGESPEPLLITQAPAEMLNPALTDSAVAARISSGRIRDPFASDRRASTRAPTRTPTRREPEPRAEPTLRETWLEDWPPGITYEGLMPRLDAPGEFAVEFNGHTVRVGEPIPGTGVSGIPDSEWVLREASTLVILIRREVKDDSRWEVTWYRHIRNESMESGR